MRLAVVSPFLDRRHGTELCIVEQIERFARMNGWTIELYSQRVEQVSGVCPASTASRKDEGCILWHKVADIPGPHLIKYLWWFAANQWQRKRNRRSNKSGPDLVYSPGINCLDADVIAVHILFCVFYERVGSQLSLRNAHVWTWARLIHRRLYYRLIMFLESRIYRNPRVQLVAVSTLIAKKLEARFGRGDVVVIPNAVDTRRFRPEACRAKRTESRLTFHFTDREIVALLIGNDWKNKGLDTVLKALVLLTDLPLRLLVVGSDAPGLHRQMLDELALQDRVRFEKPSADVVSFYAAADLYVGPSLEDSFNLPILEAMACGLPVIASAEAGASEMIRDGETGLILRDPQDYLRLSQMIRRLCGDEALRVAMGEAASQYAATNCSWEENATRTRELLESTLQRLSEK